MKHYYLLSVIFFTAFSINAQIVNIPDANFKNALVNSNCADFDGNNTLDGDVDTNDDGEIQVSEALAVIRLVVYSSDISDLTGIETFTNLTQLSCSNNSLTYIDLTQNTNLVGLFCYNNQITSLDLTQNTNLEQLVCYNNQLTSLDLSQNLNLGRLECNFNQLTSLDLTPHTNIYTLYCNDNELNNLLLPTNGSVIHLACSNNQLSSLDISQNLNIRVLGCYDNNLTSLDVTNNVNLDILRCWNNNLNTLDVSACTNLTQLFCYDNNLTSLNLSNNVNLTEISCYDNSLTSLDVSNNANLDKLRCWNNNLSTLDVSVCLNIRELICNDNNLNTLDVSPNVNLVTLRCHSNANLEYINLKNGNNDNPNIFYNSNFENLPNLQTVCVDELNSELTVFISTETGHEVTYTEYCSFSPAQSNTISGFVNVDIDNNGCDISELTNRILITADNGTESFGTFVLEDASYSMFTNEGDFTTAVTTNLPTYWGVTPNVQTNTFTGFGNSFSANFCLVPNQTINDLNIGMYPGFPPRPGFDTSYHLVYNNVGTTILSGSVTFEFDATMLNFLNASETIAAQTINSLTFNFTDLNPFETRTIDLEFNVFTPPTVEIGDILNTTATITPVTGDYTTEDNVFNLQQIVLGSYDPNDITCLQGDAILLEDADKYLHYLIRFQNSGTASAINVVVKNILDDRLDWSTLQLESTSHESRVAVTNGNEIEFIFEDINLPDENTNESASHGFIAYKIKPITDAVIGDIFDSTADIFFDFNPEITTNTASTEVVDNLSLEDNVFKNLLIYPNPVTNTLHVKANNEMSSLNIFNLLGQQISSFKPNALSTVVDLANFKSGIYLVKIVIGEQIATYKIVKD